MRWDLFRYNVRQPGTWESLVVSGALTGVFLASSIPPLVVGARNRSALVLLGLLLAVPAVLSALWFGRNVLARIR
jgi:hypothetical protein